MIKIEVLGYRETVSEDLSGLERDEQRLTVGAFLRPHSNETQRSLLEDPYFAQLVEQAEILKEIALRYLRPMTSGPTVT